MTKTTRSERRGPIDDPTDLDLTEILRRRKRGTEIQLPARDPVDRVYDAVRMMKAGHCHEAVVILRQASRDLGCRSTARAGDRMFTLRTVGQGWKAFMRRCMIHE